MVEGMTAVCGIWCLMYIYTMTLTLSYGAALINLAFATKQNKYHLVCMDLIRGGLPISVC